MYIIYIYLYTSYMYMQVVVPLSTLSNWINEFAKWAPHIIKVSK